MKYTAEGCRKDLSTEEKKEKKGYKEDEERGWAAQGAVSGAR